MSALPSPSSALRAPPRPLLLTLAYLAFVSLGLPDAVLGVSWPSLRDTFALPQTGMGIILATAAALDDPARERVHRAFAEILDDPSAERNEKGEVALHGCTYIVWTTKIPAEGRTAHDAVADVERT